MYPCMPTSPYALSKRVASCTSPADQINQTVSYLKDSGIYFSNANSSVNATVAGIYLDMLFISIEDNIPNQYFVQNTTQNGLFLAALVTQAQSLGIRVGIYTTFLDWSNIMNTGSQNPFSELPLWLPRFDKVFSMDFFVPTFSWKSLFIKQVDGQSSDGRRLGHEAKPPGDWKISLNYMDDSYILI